MAYERPLRGACACGRNSYVIEMPPNASERAQVIFDRSNTFPRAHASPLAAYLRVPLTWYHSTTYAFFDDETHTSIRRVYTPPEQTTTRRHFCGFCGTPLSYWSESPQSEADFISLTLGSLIGSDLRDLEDLGLLPRDLLNDDNDTPPREAQSQAVLAPRAESPGSGPAPTRVSHGLPWFESMIEGSKLGRVKVSRGKKETDDGRKIEWEVVEWTDADEAAAQAANAQGQSSKRKLVEVIGEDIPMA